MPDLVTVIGLGWADPATLGYPALFGGVLIGSIVPILPTGAVVSAAAAVAVATGEMSLVPVLVLSVVGALIGDLVTYGAARAGRGGLVRLLSRGRDPSFGAGVRERFHRRGGLLIVIGRLMPAGRIPTLLAAGGLAFPWRRTLPASVIGCIVWALAYLALGVLSGGLFDNPVLASLVAALLVLVVALAVSFAARWRSRRVASHRREPAPMQ